MEINELKDLVVNSLENLKAKDIVVLDVSDRTSVTDYMVIASGTSDRHVKAVADSLIADVKAQGIQPFGAEGRAAADWILVDLGDVVVHVMLPAAREFYDLERFWRDAPVDSSVIVAGELAEREGPATGDARQASLKLSSQS